MDGHNYKMQNYVAVEVGGGACTSGGRAEMSHLDATTHDSPPSDVRLATPLPLRSKRCRMN